MRHAPPSDEADPHAIASDDELSTVCGLGAIVMIGLVALLALMLGVFGQAVTR